MLESRQLGEEHLEAADGDRPFAESSYRFMAWLNRFLGGHQPVREFVDRLGPGPLRLLDIGSGSCDIPLAVADWARRRRRQVHFTCLDTNERAVHIARRRIARSGSKDVQVLREDVWAHRPGRRYDAAIGSLFFHHHSDERILSLLGHLRQIVARGVLINDLHRTRRQYAGACLLTALLPPKVRHDALVSIRSGFRPQELRGLLGRLEAADVQVRTAWFGRLAAEVWFAGTAGPAR